MLCSNPGSGFFSLQKFRLQLNPKLSIFRHFNANKCGATFSVHFTEEQIRWVVKKVKAKLGERADAALVARITREILRRLEREAEEQSRRLRQQR